MLPPRDTSQIERYTQTKSKAMQKNISHKQKRKNGRVAVLISNKTDCQIKAIVRGDGEHCIMIKGTIPQDQ